MSTLPGAAVPGTPPADAQPTPSPAAQQGQGGQGAPAPPSTDGFWGNFPDVPQEMRGALEPHLKNVQAHVTKLEQQHAPFKPLVERGFTPEQVQNLVGFLSDFDKDPKAVWLSLGRSLLENQVLHEDLDMDILEQIVNGQDIDVEEPPPAAVPGTDPNAEVPPWAQGLISKVEAWEQAEQQRQQQAQQAQEDQLMEQQLTQMRATLVQAGYREDQVTNEMLIGSLIAHRGDSNKAVEALTGLRTDSVRSFVDDKTKNGKSTEPNLPKGAPPVKEKPKTSGKRDAFADARAGAEQMLRQSAQAAAQE